MESHSKTKPNVRSHNHMKDITLMSYLKSELNRGYLLENDEERYAERRNKVYTFFMIPRETEKFFAYGFFQCADSFTFVLTFLPLRFLLACWALLARLVTWVVRLRRPPEGLLKPAEMVDIVKGVLLVSCCYLMTWIDTSVLYHLIKTQSTIKLYLFFNMLEIADRLLSAFGQDTLDALFWTATEPGNRKRDRVGGVMFHLIVALVSVFLHAVIVLLQALALNVAINADNKGLLTILISNNFVELKGSVFKKFDRINLLQICCSDVRERFHLCVLMLVVVLQTLKEYSWSAERLYILLPDIMLVFGTEILVDWIKHAFVTRFNEIPIDAYKDYTTILAHDLVMCKQKYADSDHSDLVARRMGFIPLPLGVVTFRILSQSLPLHNAMSYVLLVMAFVGILTFRVLNGIILLGKACDILKDAEKRRSRTDSSSEAASSAQLRPSKPMDDANAKSFNNFNLKAANDKLGKMTDAFGDLSLRSDSCRGCCACQREMVSVSRASDEHNYSPRGRHSTSYDAYSPNTSSHHPENLATSYSPNQSKPSQASTGDAAATVLYTTPFTSPTHLVKRVKGKRVRLDSGAMVHEIEPYAYDLSSDFEENQSDSNDDNDTKSKLHLNLSSYSKEKRTASTTGNSTPNSPESYDVSSPLSFCPDAQAGLMANSMVNLASVGLNQGPHSPEIEERNCLTSSSLRSSCSSLPAVDTERAHSLSKISLESNSLSCPNKRFHSAADNGSGLSINLTPVGCVGGGVLSDTVQDGETNSGERNVELSAIDPPNHSNDSRVIQGNLSRSFKADSAPDVRISKDSDDDDR